MAMVSALCSLIALLKVSNDASDTGCLAVARKIPFSRALLSLSLFFSILQPATGCQLCKCENVYSSFTCATCFCLSLPADADNSHLFNCFTVAARLFNVHFVDVAHFVILQCLRRWCYTTLNSDAV